MNKGYIGVAAGFGRLIRVWHSGLSHGRYVVGRLVRVSALVEPVCYVA